MAVCALITVVFVVALNFYTDLSRASARASNTTHDIRHAIAILDRVARDFEGATLLVKPPEMDPLEHPWLFVAESRNNSPGADHLKFVTRNHDPTRTETPATNLAVVAYVAKKNDRGQISLYRWSSPRLPESLEKDFPFVDDEGSYLVADDLSSFGVRLLGSGGGSGLEWDSTTTANSGDLPLAVEIQIAIADEDASEEDLSLEPSPENSYQRKVWIPVRPMEIAALTDPEAPINGGSGKEGQDDDGPEKDDKGDGGPDDDDPDKDRDCRTYAECIHCGGLEKGHSLKGVCPMFRILTGCIDKVLVGLLQDAFRPECR
jgi:hypothetical protein